MRWGWGEVRGIAGGDLGCPVAITLVSRFVMSPDDLRADKAQGFVFWGSLF